MSLDFDAMINLEGCCGSEQMIMDPRDKGPKMTAVGMDDGSVVTTAVLVALVLAITVE